MKKLVLSICLILTLLVFSACGGSTEEEAEALGSRPNVDQGNFQEYSDDTFSSEQGEHVHNWSEATCQAPKQCYICGITEGGTAEHQWQTDSCDQPQRCIYCSETKGSALGHKWVKATCTEAKHCSVCGAMEGMALGHNFSAASCTKGEQCSRCGQTGSPATGHNYVDGYCTNCRGADPNYVAPTLVYQDSGVKIYFKAYTSQGVVFKVENLTNVTITIQAEAIALNRKSTEDITMSDDVAARSTGEVTARCSIPGVGKVGLISGVLRVIDFSRGFQSYDAKFVDIKIAGGVDTSMPTATGKQLYADDKVCIYYGGYDASGMFFYVENKTDILITIQADVLSINGKSTDDITMSDDVAPRSLGRVTARCSIPGVGQPKTVGGTLRVIDFDRSFSSYDVNFVNVAV